MRAKARLRLGLPPNRTKIVFEALKPELEKPISSRSEVSLDRDDDCLVLRVEASDTVALRAALNSYLRWIGSVTSALDVVDQNLSP